MITGAMENEGIIEMSQNTILVFVIQSAIGGDNYKDNRFVNMMMMNGG